MKTEIKKFQDKTRNLKDLIFDPTVRILPGQIAFFLILSIFPLLMLIGYIGTFFDVSLTTVIDFLNSTLPEEIAETLVNFISGKSFDSSIGISMITGFILASNGSHAIILASNTLYGFPSDDFVKRRIKSMILIILLVSLFVFTAVVLAYGNIILKSAIDFFNLTGVAKTIYKVFSIAKWPVAFFVMLFVIKLIYVIAPDWKILSKNTTRGALFTALGWTIATGVFSYYVSHFANYDIFYGSLSSIVMLMIWVYVLSYILVIGIASNKKDYQDKEINMIE